MIVCPACDKPARVDQTRTPQPGRVTRRYVCKGGHAFHTTEVLASEMAELTAAAKFLARVKEMARA